MSKCFARMVYTMYKMQHIHSIRKDARHVLLISFFAAENLCSVVTALQRCLSIQPASGRPSKVAHEVKDLDHQAANGQ